MTTVAQMIGPIVIEAPNADWTPKGKRVARVVKTARGMQLRLYAGGKIYRCLPVTGQNVEMSREWMAA